MCSIHLMHLILYIFLSFFQLFVEICSIIMLQFVVNWQFIFHLVFYVLMMFCWSVKSTKLLVSRFLKWIENFVFQAFNILRYEIGQKYNSHYDAFNPTEYGPQRSQRVQSRYISFSFAHCLYTFTVLHSFLFIYLFSWHQKFRWLPSCCTWLMLKKVEKPCFHLR